MANPVSPKCDPQVQFGFDLNSSDHLTKIIDESGREKVKFIAEGAKRRKIDLNETCVTKIQNADIAINFLQIHTSSSISKMLQWNAVLPSRNMDFEKVNTTAELKEMLKSHFGNRLGNEEPIFCGVGSYCMVFKIVLDEVPMVIKFIYGEKFIKEGAVDHIQNEISHYFKLLRYDIPTVHYPDFDALGSNASTELIRQFVLQDFPGYYLAPYVEKECNSEKMIQELPVLPDEINESYLMDELDEDHPFYQIKYMLQKFWDFKIIPDVKSDNLRIDRDGRVVLCDLNNEKMACSISKSMDPLREALSVAATDFSPDQDMCSDLYSFLIPRSAR